MAGLSLFGQTGNPQLPAYEPTNSYEAVKIHGFTVRISREAREHPDDLEPALSLLREKLAEIATVVPHKPLKVLQGITIWIEHNNPDFPCACYHPDVNWLNENGYNPQKVDGMEIANVKNFVKWVTEDQPMMVLHELAHGYHDILFGYDDSYILACYKHAMVSELYDSVKYHRGQMKEGYAKTNQMEYFAELTEAYFGLNDYYPFDRDDLIEHDVNGFEMIRRIWGTPRTLPTRTVPDSRAHTMTAGGS